MLRVVAATSAAMAVMGAVSVLPLASATPPDRTIRVLDGQIRCLLSADYEGRGRPATVCGRTDGAPFQISPKGKPLAVLLATGEQYYISGTVPGDPSADLVLGPGQISKLNGWTVKTEDLRILVSYDIGRHGMRVNPIEVMPAWL
ncbi:MULTISPECIES: hypothetical protein [Mycolicibacterium]|uniref:Secreted protein n=3 Tax=Mycolicibacterium gilvum TaxID=1804 RepID=E6TJW0_MYCSR|nr:MULTISPECIES: hypothetical protein [Mycolicibacterium]ABP42980.1 conserved hypothetical protein [Mycolicibacterium gilvum PYR-GCK]ADT96990.1 hypothetical protein Mspyr1_02740 [Mycolicibacterium gilvum Spyr1]MBV5246870.1 hypothetical protein [Mycolicibacterium sp. PAM1]MCV7055965.1 hypothetical protein [Mycolicibacterium gilvum]STZ40981.1 Uncharacterised protein [Mycolicibacterium gilvum]